VGCGFVACTSSGIIKTAEYKLPDGCSIFQAEGYGIFSALSFAHDLQVRFRRIELLVDSRAASPSLLLTQ
jgi:hypothetical protein